MAAWSGECKTVGELTAKWQKITFWSKKMILYIYWASGEWCIHLSKLIKLDNLNVSFCFM